MPIFYEERQDKPDQGKIKEVNNDGKQAGCKNFPLIDGQRILLVEKIQHDTTPVRFAGPLAALERAGHGRFYNFGSDKDNNALPATGAARRRRVLFNLAGDIAAPNGAPAVDPQVYCAAAAVLVSRKAGITSFAKRSRSAS